MKIYIPNNSNQSVGGGWTFIANIEKALQDRCHFVDSVAECDVMMIVGVTITDPKEVHEAKKAGKGILLRVDNVPKKSRNRRNTPHERMKEFADLADVVVYQSQWARNYCYPLTGDGTIIYNGVDTKLFKPNEVLKPKHDRYLFAYHGKSELKGFWTAHAYFQSIVQTSNPEAEFWFINDFKRELPELQEANFDFWNDEKYKHLPFAPTPEQMAFIMQQCNYLIFPSVADAAPNTVLEARACGLEIDCPAPAEMSGTQEMIDLEDFTLERMGLEYEAVLTMIMQTV